jgi:hypothetical protein
VGGRGGAGRTCGHPGAGEEAPDRSFQRGGLEACGRIVQGVVVSARNGFGLAGVFADVLYHSVAIEDGLQVDLGPPSKQDRDD